MTPKVVEPSSQNKMSKITTYSATQGNQRSDDVVKRSASKKNVDNVADHSPSKMDKEDRLSSKEKKLDYKKNSNIKVHEKKSDNIPSSGEKKTDNGTHPTPSKKNMDSGTQSSSSVKTSSKKAPPSPAKDKTAMDVQSSSSEKASGNVLEPSSVKIKSDNAGAFSSVKKEDKGTKPSSGNKASDTRRAHLPSDEKGSDNIGHPASPGKKEADKAIQRSSSEKKSDKKEKLDTTIQASQPIVPLIQTKSSGSQSESTEQARKLIKRHRSLELKPDALAIRANARPLLRSGGSKMIISFRKSEAISTSYISARLSMVQILSKGLCFLKLDVQSIRSPHTRIDAMNIRWQFARSMRNFGSISPVVKEVAPKQSIGARDEEIRQAKYGLEVPVQASQMGVTVGPKFTADFSADKKVVRGMVITGFIQGDEEAGWRVKENSGAMSGVPSHFCVGVVIQYSGVIAMELELHAAQRVEFSMGLSLRSQPLHARMAIELDVDSLQHDFEPENPPETWKEWFSKITGDVEGYNLSHSQVALTS